MAKKNVSTSVTLRAPKNFNIGKYRVLTLNYKTPKFFWKTNLKLKLTSLLNSPQILYKYSVKRVKSTPTVYVNSIRFTVKTKFKIKWLGIWFFL